MIINRPNRERIEQRLKEEEKQKQISEGMVEHYSCLLYYSLFVVEAGRFIPNKCNWRQCMFCYPRMQSSRNGNTKLSQVQSGGDSSSITRNELKWLQSV